MRCKIINLYRNSDGLKGEAYLRPLKAYQGFFTKNKFVYFVTAPFCYPVVGLVAAFGLVLSWADLVCKNQEVMRLLDQIVLGVLEARVVQHRHFEFTCDQEYCWNEKRHRHGSGEKFVLEKENVQQIHRVIEKKIDELTKSAELCCFRCVGTTESNGKLIYTLFS